MNISKKISLTFAFITLIGAGCSPTKSNPENSAQNPPPTAIALELCNQKPYTAEFAKIFGEKNYPSLDWNYTDGFRTPENTCTYSGLELQNNKNYIFSVAVVPDENKKFYTWKKEFNDSAGTEVLPINDTALPAGSFYKKVTILPQINYDETRKVQTSWDLVVHNNGVTFNIADLPQFADMTEAQVKEIMASIIKITASQKNIQ